MPKEQDLQGLKESLSHKGVKYCLPSYVDIHGVSKSKFVPIEHFDRMMNGSELCTGAALDGGPQDVSDEEVSSRPDPESIIILPWRKDTAWFASDLWCEGKPFEPCSRNIFKGVLAQATDMGYTFNFGIEPEFFLLQEDEQGGFVPIGPRDDLAKPAYDIRSTLDSLELLEEIVSTLNDLGYDVYSYDHEDGNGQFEIDFMYCDGLTMADRFIFFRHLIQELAHQRGFFASFMPKPFSDRAGSGAHYNMSLADIESGANLFESDNDPRGCGITELGYWFIGGILKHLPALSAVISPTVNSYKRLIKTGSMSGFTWAPVFACFGNNNRTNSIRVPLGGGRVELRAADISNNPYLGGAMVLAAGLEGIQEKIDPGAPYTENMYLKSEAELEQLGVSYLPRSLEEAVDAFEKDDLGRQVMGDLMAKTYADFKRAEWDEYLTHVSDWEVSRYLKLW
ncbi:MAG: type III glutamate--ammonia ligase [Pseudomonadota bacterium]|nr:type III glutamate--ammonia ligase [Pseudomonadota bacterium]